MGPASEFHILASGMYLGLWIMAQSGEILHGIPEDRCVVKIEKEQEDRWIWKEVGCGG